MKHLDFDEIIKRFENSPEAINVSLLNEIFDVLRIMEHEVNLNIQKPLSNYIIIRCVSAIENFFKNYARELIDKNNTPASEIFSKDEKIPLTKLDELKDVKITKGKIIAYTINFQDLDKINSLMSTILSIDFFKEIDKQKHAFTYAVWNETTFFRLKEVYELFELRHKIVHEISDFEDKPSDLRRIFAQVFLFLSTSHTIIQKFKK